MNRRGFHLVEVTVALLVVAGPLLVVLRLAHGSAVGAASETRRAAARALLTDTLEQLVAEPLDRLRAPCGPGGRVALAELVERRVERMPEAARKAHREQLEPLLATTEATLEEDVDGQAGLARLTLRVLVEPKVPVSVRVLLRTAARRRV